MDTALAIARGPLFTASCFLMGLGLARLVLLRIWEYHRSWKCAVRKSRQRFPIRRAVKDMAAWMVPVTHIHHAGWVIGVLSFLFHFGLILVPIFLLDHIALWERLLGFSWIALPRLGADTLTLLTLASGIGLFCIRTFHAPSRFMSGVADYLLLALLLVPFGTGLLASHPTWNIFSYKATMLVHVLSANLVMVLMPFTKLSHAVLFPFERISSEVYWRFPAGAGDRVANALHGKEPAVL